MSSVTWQAQRSERIAQTAPSLTRKLFGATSYQRG
jgi:hypothetical protein